MRISTDGLILTEQTIKENDKLVTVLTRSEGVIRCFVRGAKLLKGHNSVASGLFSYSKFQLYSGNSGYTIDHADQISAFFGISSDLEKLALAQYFAQAAIHVIPEGIKADEYLSLMLNSLYVISEGLKPLLQVKAVFEMRMMTLAGFMPFLLCCDGCKCYESDRMYLLYENKRLLCENCYTGGEADMLTKGALSALRHSVFSEPKKIFAFSASDEAIRCFAHCAEHYFLSNTDCRFKALEYFKSIYGAV